MFSTPVARLSIAALALTGAILLPSSNTMADAIDPVVVGHNVVYFDESGKAYSLDGQHKEKGKDGKFHLVPQPIDFTKVNGVPTAIQGGKFDVYRVNPGSLLLQDPGTSPSDSDLIVFTMPADKKERQKLLFCSDDTKENPPDPAADTWADVGVSKCKSQDPKMTFKEVDLSNYTVVVHYKFGEDYDVTSQLILKASSVTYTSRMRATSVLLRTLRLYVLCRRCCKTLGLPVHS